MTAEKATDPKSTDKPERHSSQSAPGGELGIESPQAASSALVQRAKLNPRLLTSRDIVQLQRLIGNQAVSHLLSSKQTPPTVQDNDDATDREADPSTTPNETTPSTGSETIQRSLVIGGNNWYTSARDVRDAAFDKAGANAQSIENLAAMAEDGSKVHRYASWEEALSATDVPIETFGLTPVPQDIPAMPDVEDESVADEEDGSEGEEESSVTIENETRMGFEIETGNHFRVKKGFKAVIEPLINETLATTEYLEFVIDDFNEKLGTVQIEFRTRPLTTEEMASAKAIKKAIDKAIKEFPVLAFKGEYGPVKAALEGRGWTVKADRLEALAGGLTPLQKGRLSPRPVQHVTHSIPLATFVKLAKPEKNLLIPGSGDAKTIEDLLILFMKKINSQVSKGTINVTTLGRNAVTPNMKTAVDTIIGLLEPTIASALIAQIQPIAPTSVTVVEDVGAIPKLEIYTEIPEFPRFNPQDRRGYLAMEEKLKAPMFDTVKKDVRVLIEHRGDNLVTAVNAAMAGDATKLAPYIAIFAKLDSSAVQGDAVFEHWFSDE